jgi:hypothetical protein
MHTESKALQLLNTSILYALLAELNSLIHQHEFTINSFVYAVNIIAVAAAR